MQPDPQIHHRRSIRLKGYDYTLPGAYFVTICTYQRDEILGAAVDNKIQLSPLGMIVQSEWFHSGEIRKEIRLFEDEFVVMPNHIHGIVWIVENDIVGADGVRPMRKDDAADSGASLAPLHAPLHTPLDAGAYHAPLRRAGRSLSSFVAGFKAAVSSRAGRELNSANIWQRNYYEHIIRNESELQNIWNYIDTNPLSWQEDQLHPSAPFNPFNRE